MNCSFRIFNANLIRQAVIGLVLLAGISGTMTLGQAPSLEPPALPPNLARPQIPPVSLPAASDTVQLAQKADLGMPKGMEAPTATPANELPAVDMIVPINQKFLIRPPGFGMLVKGDIAIDRPDILGLEDTADIKILPSKLEIEISAVKLGIVRVTFHDAKNTGNVKTYTIRVVPDIIYLNGLVRTRYPTANLNVVAAGDNLLLLEGTAENPGDVASAEKLLRHFFSGGIVNNVRVGGIMQVQLEVIIVRVDRRALRRLGVNALFADPRNGIGTQIGNLISTPAFNLPNAATALNTGASTFNPIGGTTQALTSTSTLFFGVTDSTRGLFGFIEALRQNNAARVLANPTLVTYNGRTADFLVGGKQPIPTQGQNGIPVVQFEPFGTRLSFLPTVMGEGKIRLEVVPEVSTIDSTNSVTVGTIQVPRFIVQRLHATVELQTGQTLCLGGLLQTENEAQTEKVPILGDLPGIGTLFRRVRQGTIETELLVLITPRLFDPLQPSQAPRMLPGQETTTPSDAQLFLNSQLETRRPAADPTPPKLGDRFTDSVAPYQRHPVPVSSNTRAPSDRLPPPLLGNAPPEDQGKPMVIRGQAPTAALFRWEEVYHRPTPQWKYPWQ